MVVGAGVGSKCAEGGLGSTWQGQSRMSSQPRCGGAADWVCEQGGGLQRQPAPECLPSPNRR